MGKICSKCKIEKELGEYHKYKNSKDGVKNICKKCISDNNIKPVSSFDKSEKMCIINSLDNLQPLWALDNLKKSNKIIN